MQFQDFVADQVFSPALIADELRTTKGRDRRHPGPRQGRVHTHVARPGTQDPGSSPPDAGNSQPRRGPRPAPRSRAYAWFRAEPLPGFGGATPDQLVREGRAEHVHAYLDRIMAGGYA